MSWINNICVLVTMMVMTGCVETIIMDPAEKDLPVAVNCLLTPNSPIQTLYLQHVKGKATKEYAPIKDAKVYVTHGNDTLHFHYVTGNTWESDPSHIEGGSLYRLLVEIPGRDAVRSETTCPIAFRPYHYTDLYEVNSMNLHSIFYQIEARNPISGEKIQVKTSPVWIFARGIHKTMELCDEYYPYLVTDHPYADDFNINGLKFANLSITGEFDGSCMPIAWPAFTNMRRMMPNLPLHDDCVRIEHLDTNRFHLLAGPLEFPKDKPHQDFFLFTFVSDEYDEYLRSVYVKNKKTEHDLTSIYSTEVVYTNIEGGVGIFGAKIDYQVGFLHN